jgi:tetratricopeptide (TPR) repeat protein
MFTSKGVRFFLVYPNASDDDQAIAEHRRAFQFPGASVRDPNHELVRMAQATVTPEAAVFDVVGRLVYHGRIDDRYADFGVDRPTPTHRELQDALEAVIADRPAAVPTARAVGCFISDLSSNPSPITFAKDIAPLVFDRCASCHRPTGPAPFSLLTYAQVKQRARLIATVTDGGFMPPWKADADGGPFIGQKPLTRAERDMIRQWVDAGAPEGDARDVPPTPTWVDDWQLGKPDLVVTIPTAYELQAEASDVFRIFALPLPVDRTRYVRGIEFRPGNPRVVHHANIRLDRTAASRQLDEADAAPGYDGLMPRSAEYPDGHFLGWTPGQVAPLVSPDLAWRLEPGTDLVLQLHMQPSGTVERVQPSIGLYFSDTPPTRSPSILRLGSQGIDIAPGEAEHVITDSYVLPVDVTLLALQPHAHYRAREVLGTATLPDGSTRSLIHIKQWDFRWQHVYRYETPPVFPKGTTFAMRYIFDNSADNVRNPQQPPARVLWGQRSRDEMGDLWFQLLTNNDRDRARLNAEVRGKMTAEDIVGYETMLIANPADAELHDDVAVLYLGLNRPADAVRHFAASASIKPGSAASHFNLATALSVASRLPEAVAEYRRALDIRPDYANAHNNLGSVLASMGQRREAVAHFREAMRLDPTHAQSFSNLAWHLAVSDESTAEERSEAVTFAERAATLTARTDQYALDVLAAAYASTGDFARAAAIVREALAIDPAGPRARDIRERAALYAAQKPFVQSSPR